jgi:hypothetical protein
VSDSPAYWSQPNQQVVRAGDPVGVISSDPDPQASTAPARPGGTFDPGEHTVQDVLSHVERHPDDRDAIVKAERRGKGRTTLLDSLTGVEDDTK